MKRLIWADIVRILAIYLIILIHLVPNGTTDDYILNLVQVVTHSSVPLFVMLSGALLLGKSENYFLFFKKRAVRVILPWVFWSIIFTIISALVFKNFDLKQIFSTFHQIFIPLFWFIPLILALYLATPALRIFVQHAKRFEISFVIIIWFLGICLMPYLRNSEAFPLSTDSGIARQFLEYFGYYLMGYYLATKKYKSGTTKILLLILTLTITLTVIIQTFINTANIKNVYFFDYHSPGIVIITGALFTIIYLGESYFQKVLNVRFKNIIHNISKASFGIFFVHFLFLERSPIPAIYNFTKLMIFKIPALDPIISGIILFIVCYALIEMLKKIPLFKNFIT